MQVGGGELTKRKLASAKPYPTSHGRNKNTVVHTSVKGGEVVGLSGCGRLDLKGDRPTAVVISDKKRLLRQSLPTPLTIGVRTDGTLRQPDFASDSEAGDRDENLLVIEESRSGDTTTVRIVGLKSRNRFRRRRGDAGGCRCCARGGSRG